MVVLRDGKSYDSSHASAATPERPRRSTRRASTARQSAGPSELTTDEPLLTESEPATPQSAAKKKRIRAAEVVQLQPLAEAEEQQDDTARDQAALQAAAETDLPSPSSTPSPLHKKARPGTPQPSKAAKQLKQERTRDAGPATTAAVVLLLAVAGAALWPHYSGAASQFTQQVLQRLEQQAATAAASLVAAGASARSLLQAHTAGAQQHLHAVLVQLHVKYPTIVPEGGLQGWGWGLQDFRLQDPTAWAPEVLAGILPGGQQWEDLAGDISERLRMPAAGRSHKATALILACGSTDDCGDAAAALAVLPPRGEVCSLLLNAARLVSSDRPAAALQAALAPFLRRCPAGLVLLQDVQQLPVAAVPALQNALSELGGFQHDGFVDGSKAAYALLLQLPAQDVMAAVSAADAAAAGSSIKEAFFYLQQQQLDGQQQQEQGADADALGVAARALKALHRRIDFAVPVKLGTAAEEALDQFFTDDAAAADPEAMADETSQPAAEAASAEGTAEAAGAAAEAGYETASEGDGEEVAAPAAGEAVAAAAAAAE